MSACVYVSIRYMCVVFRGLSGTTEANLLPSVDLTDKPTQTDQELILEGGICHYLFLKCFKSIRYQGMLLYSQPKSLHAIIFNFLSSIEIKF